MSKYLKNARHERFAQLAASGETLGEAYRLVYGSKTKNARKKGHELKQRPEVAKRIREMREEGQEMVGWSKALRMKYLQEFVESPLSAIGQESPFCQGVKRTAFGVECRIPNKLRSIVVYSRLAGDFGEPRMPEATAEDLYARIMATE